MTSVGQFAQYLLRQDPQRTPGRTVLFNFLKHVMDPNAPFTPAVLQLFYARVLQFDHWQQESQALSATVRADLEDFLSQIPNTPEQEAWRALRHADTLQIVPLKLFQDLEQLVQAEHAARQKSGDELKTVKISETQVLALLLQPSGSLEAKVYPNQALVWGPRLRLVAPTTYLTYSSDLELTPHVRQILEGSLMTTHSFHVDSEGVHGLITRGHSFQKFETFIRAKLSETQDLFTSLKKIERHFIDPQSDSFYQELIARLERANRLLNHPSPDNLAEAERVLNRGRLTLKTIFPNDRLLTLLVTHLDYGISQRRSAPNTVSQRVRAQTQ
jgi:hypothetical protein